jgi:hypothetical protein
LFIPDPDPDFLPIPDPGVEKAPDPGPRIRIRNNVVQNRVRIQLSQVSPDMILKGVQIQKFLKIEIEELKAGASVAIATS